jgi:outer membrane protein OmpA-like peptidoglycan-associated protein
MNMRTRGPAALPGVAVPARTRRPGGPALHRPAPAAVTAAFVQRLQRGAGNRAVASLLTDRDCSTRPGSLRTAAAAVQRQPTPAAPARAEEIASSRSAPGGVDGTVTPLVVSLFGFAIDDGEPKAVHRTAIAVVARAIRAVPGGTVVVVATGHTDVTGPGPHNDALSGRRAAAVAALLTAATGEPVDVQGRGAAEPVADNGSATGRSRNRRVDIRLELPQTGRPDGQPAPGTTPAQPGAGGSAGPGPVPQPGGPTRPPGQPGPTPEQPGVDGLCGDHPLACLLIVLAGLAGLGATAFGDLGAVLAGLGTLGELLRRLLGGGAPVPPGPPEPPDRPPDQPREPDEPAPPAVTFGRVRHFTTPGGFPDRLPPAGSALFTPVDVTLVGDPGRDPVVVSAAGSVRDGTVRINGGFSTPLVAGGPLQIRGVVQTFAGAGPLRLVAHWRGTQVGESDPFFVTAVAERVRYREGELRKVGFRGILAFASWSSDSNSLVDLRGTEVQEAIRVTEATGCFEGAQPEAPPPFPADRPAGDTVAASIDRMQSPGVISVEQVHRFLDPRSGGDGAMVASGFLMRLTVRDLLDPDFLELIVFKTGQPASADGLTSSGGETSPSPISRVLQVPRLSPLPGGGGGGVPPVPVPVPVPGPGPRRPGGDATATEPRPFRGTSIPGVVPLHYLGGLPPDPRVGDRHTVAIGFVTASGRHTTELPVEVTGLTRTHVHVETTNETPVDIAPEGEVPPVVIASGTPGRVRLEKLGTPSVTPDAGAELPGGVGAPH